MSKVLCRCLVLCFRALCLASGLCCLEPMFSQLFCSIPAVLRRTYTKNSRTSPIFTPLVLRTSLNVSTGDIVANYFSPEVAFARIEVDGIVRSKKKKREKNSQSSCLTRHKKNNTVAKMWNITQGLEENDVQKCMISANIVTQGAIGHRDR